MRVSTLTWPWISGTDRPFWSSWTAWRTKAVQSSASRRDTRLSASTWPLTPVRYNGTAPSRIPENWFHCGTVFTDSLKFYPIRINSFCNFGLIWKKKFVDLKRDTVRVGAINGKSKWNGDECSRRNPANNVHSLIFTFDGHKCIYSDVIVEIGSKTSLSVKVNGQGLYFQLKHERVHIWHRAIDTIRSLVNELARLSENGLEWMKVAFQ